ncbi:MAG: 2-oxoglutarate dehydrogenase complex dihydrolipoyllysine-residue succinyltransferase [Bacteroidales bacterium]|nr:2-oxoglutarate dehydrogenase complex dihydrolipoyllysine-residue succinyltransferase [Bacteroidales bacterium]MDZ4204590.1 2-oxoglutarate dehydrogenase complex dihydrolipoyllysine-residue succinyltransferase [Bacteroidales bacterium]
MIIEIKVPSPGESITEVQLASWLANDGDYVEKDIDIVEIDSDKATLSLSAPESGILKIMVQQGETIKVGSVIATLEVTVQAPGAKKRAVRDEKPHSSEPVDAGAEAKPAEKEKVKHPVADAKLPGDLQVSVSPLARKLMTEKSIREGKIINHFYHLRISRSDVEEYISRKVKPVSMPGQPVFDGSREVERKKLSTLRLKLAQRLVAVKQEMAMLTTFNEVDMTRVIALRKQYAEPFKKKYGVGIGFVSFFALAVSEALKHFPQVNSHLDGDEMIFHKYVDIGIAVTAPKGLVVPVIRNVETLGLEQIEHKIKELATRARDNKITLEEMTGGTFTITNGGVFGSMLSTPIINPPQSAILGMHNIIDRPVAIDGKVEIRPMMYLALSFDHRVIDGRESVGFLVKVKQMIEDPSTMLFEGNDPMQALLEL